MRAAVLDSRRFLGTTATMTPDERIPGERPGPLPWWQYSDTTGPRLWISGSLLLLSGGFFVLRAAFGGVSAVLWAVGLIWLLQGSWILATGVVLLRRRNRRSSASSAAVPAD